VTLASDTWNALPDADRARLAGVITERQILDIDTELARAKAAYEDHLSKALKHRCNLVRSLHKWETENSTTSDK
jgi:hypothetical protein